MRSSGPAGIHLSMPQALLLALHLRDAGRLDVPESAEVPAFGPVVPAVAQLRSAGTGVAGRAAAGRQWARWWADSFPGGPQALTSILPPRFPGLRGMPELRGLAELDMDDAIAWCARARRAEAEALTAAPSALFETNLITEVERELGRRFRPFSLPVVVLPVRGREHWDTPLGPVITLGLRADRDAYLAWLRERLLRIGRSRARFEGSGVTD